ncbi:MAG: pilus assembly protein TadG-related protein [Aeromicrobium sp.]|uniref:pilus assembly protein TadG-related protein n=1 Tax=Aeromicrobium sp. TaxID=1871063 RepID=UPI0039E5BCBB
MTRRDDGQITLLTVGLFAVLGVLAAVVVNASDAFLERQRLNGLADGAAIEAADALDLAAYYDDGQMTLDLGAARARVAEHVADTPGVRVLEVRLDGDRVTVRLAQDISLPLAPPGMPSTTTITAEATGRLHPSS